MTALKTLAFGFGLVLAAAQFTPSAKADEWNKETRVTFANPVEVRGRVLLPGSYVFKLAESDSDRQIGQIYNDNNRFVTSIMAVSDYRNDAPNNTVLTFKEGRKDSPESIKEWFYPGDNSGLKFLYPHRHN